MKRCSKLDKKRVRRKEQAKTVAFKRRKAQLRRMKKKRERAATVREGPTYSTDFEYNYNETNCDEIPTYLALSGNESYITFDLETTGLSRNSEITQIAASVNNDSFQSYVLPRCQISTTASKVTGLSYNQGTDKLYLRGTEVKAVPIQSALLDFIDFLKSHENPVLVGHNICSFDIPVW